MRKEANKMTVNTQEMKHYIVDVTVYTNDNDVRSRFISDSAGLALLKRLDGCTIDFGEIFDEYFDVEGVFRASNIKTEEITSEEAETLIKYVGRSLSTYYLPDFFEGESND